jgi:hypothetical protein
MTRCSIARSRSSWFRTDLPIGADRADYLVRFRREAQAAGRCTYANIVSIYDFAIREGNPYFAMEYVEGASLSQALARVGPFKPAMAVLVIGQVPDQAAQLVRGRPSPLYSAGRRHKFGQNRPTDRPLWRGSEKAVNGSCGRKLAETGTAGLGYPTATSRHSFMGTANGSRRPQAAVARPQRLQPESTQSGGRVTAAAQLLPCSPFANWTHPY